MIGIIGGSGLYSIKEVIVKEKRKISTPFGSPSDSYIIGEFSGSNIIFLPRHGSHHTLPPHMINYKANIWGFRKLGAERILSLGATGGISSKTNPGEIVIPDQIIDMTNRRDLTFYEGEGGVVHIDFTEPYCHELRKSIFQAGKRSGIPLKKSGTYVCTNGPRLETKAEIKYFSTIGADVVGMTSMPEASLAREAKLCYAGICVVTNYAAGIRKKRLTTTEVKQVMNQSLGKLRALLKEVFNLIPTKKRCTCKESLKEAKV